MKSLQGLLDRGIVVKAVDLQEVDVWRVKTLQGRLDLVEDSGSAQAKLVLVVLGRLEGLSLQRVAGLGLLGNRSPALCEDDYLVAWDIVLLQGLADDLLAGTVRIDVRRVPGVQTHIIGLLEKRQCLEGG